MPRTRGIRFRRKNTDYLRDGAQQNVVQVNELNEKSKLQSDYKAKLGELGLTEIDIESCEVGDYWKEELTDLIVQYESTFSRDKLDCGEVKNTVHRIRLKDEKPFRLPYRRVPPTHYQKLRQTLGNFPVISECAPSNAREQHGFSRGKLEVVSTEGVRAVFESCLNWEASSTVNSVHLAQNNHFAHGGASTLPVFSMEDVRRKQKADPTVSRVAFFVERKTRPSRRERDNETAPVIRLLKHWERFEVKDGVLYRRSKDRVGKVRYQLVLPLSLRIVALRGTHDDAGHQGQSRTLHLVRQRFFWSGMDADVKKYVSHCKRCVVGKTQEPEARAPLESIRTNAPLELVCMDFWSAEGAHGESIDVLVITDHFTKLAHAFPCPNQTAKVVAQKLWNNFFCVYGFPQRIHSDKGANFESKLIAELLLVSGVEKSHTTPYHPMGNGQTERFNRTLGSMIRSLPPRAKEKWPQIIQTLTFSYNCTTHETTGFAPFYLMFGRIPKLPVDVMFGSALRNEDVQTYDEYVKSFQKDLREAVHIAKSNTTDAQRKQAQVYNKRSKGAPLEVGDRVLLVNKKERGKGKLADKWDSAVHVVIWKDPSLPIYRVENPTTKNSKVVHRNFLLPVNFLPLEEPDIESTVVSTLSEEDKDQIEDQRSLFSMGRESRSSRTVLWKI
ncbi:hypothetical protein DPEC_G00168570 [Dallia pectoralis]|uniref:Uncharacterized protein n=1 Tax=Dallia pectoralis TaxID=75939 RepID=A0ACC2GCZ6_DALPE|nr:hypothetical protein DPEC_G00168570 [Dallia pectoralis]